MSIPRLAAAISSIDDDLLTEAITYLPARGDQFKAFCVRVSLVACACLAIAVFLRATKDTSPDGPVLLHPVETIPYQTEEINSSAPNLMDIQINEISPNYFEPQGMFALIGENFEEMTRDEILNYFGVVLDLSSVMPNMRECENTRYGFYHFGDGSIFGQFAFNYVDDKTHQTLSIVLRNGGLPTTMIIEAYHHGLQKSMLCGKEVMVAHYIDLEGNSKYYAEFSDGDLGVMVTAEGCLIEDFVRTLEYLAES